MLPHSIKVSLPINMTILWRKEKAVTEALMEDGPIACLVHLERVKWRMFNRLVCEESVSFNIYFFSQISPCLIE